jgi:xylulokinase
MADVFNAEVVTLAVGEGAAYGAALQAMWCWRKNRGEKLAISDLSDRFVKLNRRETARPRKANVAVYREIQAIQDQLSSALRPVFKRHRGLVSCE